MKVILYNDSPELLHPFTHMRPTWDMVIGGRTLRTFLESSFPDAKIELKNENIPHLEGEGLGGVNNKIHLSGRTLPSNENIKNLQADSYKLQAINAPWELMTHHAQLLEEEIQSRIDSGNYTEIRPNVFIPLLSKKRLGEVYKLNDSIITNTEKGPIILGSVGAENLQPVFGHHTVLSGPLIIEKGCTIKNFTDIKGSYIGPVCKMGGEISGVNFFGYSNKVHHGFVGDSVVAEWVNFGAGSTTSNMKNTYGKVRINTPSPLKGEGMGEVYKNTIPSHPAPGRGGNKGGVEKQETNLQFLGSLVGDHTKTAINTTLMTGTVLGVSTHAYDVVHGSIPSFTQIFRGQRVELPLEVALTIANRAMARRDVAISEEQKKTLSSVFESTAKSRKQFNVKQNTKLSFE